MKIKYQKSFKAAKGLLVVPIFSAQLKKTPSFIPKEVKDFAKQAAKNESFQAKEGSTKQTYLSETKLLLIGAGDSKKFSTPNALNIGGHIGKFAKNHKYQEITLLITEDFLANVGEIVEGMLSAQYDIGIAKNRSKKDQSYTLKTLNLLLEKNDKTIKSDVDKALLINQAQVLVKDLTNNPANITHAEKMAKTAKKVAKDHKLKITIFDKKKLTKMGAGGILAVNQGCTREPNMIMLEYYGAKSKKEKPIFIVGKGVIFDTGGYNLKPSGYMETMHHDMAGAATVMGVMTLLKDLQIKRNVIALMPCVENLVNENAYRPSDIITMLSGHTVEVTNTDAEGRMILADALYYASQADPEMIISIATLTGAVEVALGHRYAGLMSNNQIQRAKMQAAGTLVDELAWSLPIHDDYRKEMKSKFADLKNHNTGSRGAGTAKAAAFLENFVDQKPWLHLDIGGTAWTKSPKPYQTKYATSHGLKMILQYIMDYEA